MSKEYQPYLTPALVTVAACTFGAYFIWKQSYTSSAEPSSTNETLPTNRNQRTETIPEDRATLAVGKKSAEAKLDHSYHKISARCEASLRVSEKGQVPVCDNVHGFSEAPKELEQTVMEVNIEAKQAIPPALIESSLPINEVSDIESNDALSNYKVNPPDLLQSNDSKNEAIDGESDENVDNNDVNPPDLLQSNDSKNEVIDGESDENVDNNDIILSDLQASKSKVETAYFKSDETANHSNVAVQDLLLSSVSEIEAPDFGSNTVINKKNLEPTTSEENISKQEVCSPVPSQDIGSTNKVPKSESKQVINNNNFTAPDSLLVYGTRIQIPDFESYLDISENVVNPLILNENIGSTNEIQHNEPDEAVDNNTFPTQDRLQTSGSNNELKNIGSNDNAVNSTVSQSDDIQRIQAFLQSTSHVEGEHLNRMAFKRKRWSKNPMYLALREGNLPVVLSLLRQGASIDFTDRQGQFPTHLAAASGNIELLEMLVSWGGDLSKTDMFGYTPFHRAAHTGQTETIRWLHERGGAFLTETSWSGWTALHIAAMNGHYHTSVQLLEMGANVNAKDKDGWTPLYLAKIYKRIEVMKLLESWGGTV